MATTTPNLGLTKPTVGADADAWGTQLNASLDTLDAKVLDKTTGGSISGAVNVIAATTAPAVRITQTGTGEALRVEDEANPDATPFVIDAAGNVGVGTTSPQRKLDIYDATAPTFALHNSTSGTGINDGFLLFTLGANTTLLNYENGYMAFSTNDTERARITSGGNLLVGTTSDAGYRLGIGGNGATLSDGVYTGYVGKASVFVASGGTAADFGVRSDANLLFATGGSTERARITSAGFAKFSNTGVYSAGGANNHYFENNDNAPVIISFGNNTGVDVRSFDSRLPAAAGGVHFAGFTNNALVYRVLANGNVQNASGAAISPISSDARIKQVTDTLDDALDVITKLRPVKFDYMGKHESFGKNIYGFIAQEVGQAKPDAVMDSGLKDEDIPDLKTYDASFIVPYLVKALQQSNARVEQLESRIAALEAK